MPYGNSNIHVVDRCFINRQAFNLIVDIKSVYKLSLRRDHCIQTLSLLYMCVYIDTQTYMFIHHLSPAIQHNCIYSKKSQSFFFYNFKFFKGIPWSNFCFKPDYRSHIGWPAVCKSFWDEIPPWFSWIVEQHSIKYSYIRRDCGPQQSTFLGRFLYIYLYLGISSIRQTNLRLRLPLIVKNSLLNLSVFSHSQFGIQHLYFEILIFLNLFTSVFFSLNIQLWLTIAYVPKVCSTGCK